MTNIEEGVIVHWAIQHQSKNRPYEGWFVMAHSNLKTLAEAEKAMKYCQENEWMDDLNHRIVKVTTSTQPVGTSRRQKEEEND